MYIDGLSGKIPDIPLYYSQLKKKAKERLNRKAYDYVAGGAGAETSMHSNRLAFEAQKIVPRMMRDVSDYDLSCRLLERDLPIPLILAPIGVLELAHSEADRSIARLASSWNIPLVFSNQASVSMEECSRLMGDSPRWFQLYWSRSDDLTKSLIRRAENAGCGVIVLTLDTTLLGWRRRDLGHGYLPFLEGKGLAQYTSDPVFRELMRETVESGEGMQTRARDLTPSLLRSIYRLMRDFPGSVWDNWRSKRPLRAVKTFIDVYSRPNLKWEDLNRLREWTDLPIVLKGVLHPEDARKAIEYGADGLWVSNHGGRQIDGAISSLQALQNIRKVLDRKVPVILDSGVRTGADMFKALALGADAVAVGRPYVFALASGGEDGVRHWMEFFMAEFELTMRLSGCRSIEEIGPDTLE